MGYYWHAPVDFDSNRGLGGGIQWAWDDALCKDTGEAHGFPFLANHSSFEEQFHEDLFFTNFISCSDIKASLHRAFQVWEDVNQHIRFVDVTEECRSLYGRVQSNCSLLELFITGQVDSGRIDDVGKPYPYGGEGYPYPDPLTGGSLADVVTGFFFRGRRARRRRRLADEGTRSDAAASATQASK